MHYLLIQSAQYQLTLLRIYCSAPSSVQQFGATAEIVHPSRFRPVPAPSPGPNRSALIRRCRFSSSRVQQPWFLVVPYALV